jgi:hypothetical protein
MSYKTSLIKFLMCIGCVWNTVHAADVGRPAVWERQTSQRIIGVFMLTSESQKRILPHLTYREIFTKEVVFESSSLLKTVARGFFSGAVIALRPHYIRSAESVVVAPGRLGGVSDGSSRTLPNSPQSGDSYPCEIENSVGAREVTALGVALCLDRQSWQEPDLRQVTRGDLSIDLPLCESFLESYEFPSSETQNEKGIVLFRISQIARPIYCYKKSVVIGRTFVDTFDSKALSVGDGTYLIHGRFSITRVELSNGKLMTRGSTHSITNASVYAIKLELENKGVLDKRPKDAIWRYRVVESAVVAEATSKPKKVSVK